MEKLFKEYKKAFYGLGEAAARSCIYIALEDGISPEDAILQIATHVLTAHTDSEITRKTTLSQLQNSILNIELVARDAILDS